MSGTRNFSVRSPKWKRSSLLAAKSAHTSKMHQRGRPDETRVHESRGPLTSRSSAGDDGLEPLEQIRILVDVPLPFALEPVGMIALPATARGGLLHRVWARKADTISNTRESRQPQKGGRRLGNPGDGPCVYTFPDGDDVPPVCACLAEERVRHTEHRPRWRLMRVDQQ